MDSLDCTIFEDRLDAWREGALPADVGPEFLRHGAACAACGALLRLAGHLDSPTLAELEARVPDAWVDGMWAAVRRKTAPTPRRWAVPLLAAAVAALLLATGLSFGALRRSEAARVALAVQLEAATPMAPRAAGPLDGSTATPPGFATRDRWRRALESRDEITIDELRGLLDRVPPGSPLLDVAGTGARGWAPLLPRTWRVALRALPEDRPVTAGDLLRALDRMDLPGGASVPTARLLDLLS